MRVGFTGTRQGLTIAQKRALQTVLEGIACDEFHHGDAIGADASAHGLMLGRCQIHIHPSTLSGQRAFCKGFKTYMPKLPLDRNIDIVNASQIIVACPFDVENQRGGTWHTVRYARKVERQIYIVLTDGKVERENVR